jgi:hypothetical protein
MPAELPSRADLLNATLSIYPDAAHGFLFQHPHEFAAEVNAFLGLEEWLWRAGSRYWERARSVACSAFCSRTPATT